MKVTPDFGCSILDCDLPRDEDAPLALCEHHLRTAFAYVLRDYADNCAEHVEPTGEPPTIHRQISKEPGWVYFVRRGDEIKIGWSSTPNTRVRSLGGIDAVLHMEPGTMADEKRCHTAFAHLRVHGEWFRDTSELRSFIGDLHHGSPTLRVTA